MPSSVDLSDLLVPLFDGGYEDPLWGGFLHRLRERTAASYASLIFRPSAPLRPSLMHLFSGESSPPPIQRLYRESLHRRDPVDYHRLRDGHVHALDELFIVGDVAHDQYRREMLAPSGMNDFRLMRIIEQSGVNVWLTVSRRAGRFAPADGRLIGMLAPYLRAALRGYVALERERLTDAIAGEAIRRLQFGWLTLAADGTILDTDAQGARLLDHSGLLRRGPGGRLAARSKPLDREIAEAIHALAASPHGRPRALVLSRDPWLDMLLVPAHRRSTPAGPAPAIIAYVHADNWSSADRRDQLADLFELLPSEARLALALSRGMTIAEAAVELGLTIETARTYSKRIYAKTGARGQPDLVRFVHRSVLAIA